MSVPPGAPARADAHGFRNTCNLTDEEFGHRIYALSTPLQPDTGQPTIVIYDGACANEKRRRQKRGMPQHRPGVEQPFGRTIPQYRPHHLNRTLTLTDGRIATEGAEHAGRARGVSVPVMR